MLIIDLETFSSDIGHRKSLKLLFFVPVTVVAQPADLSL
jgi:hypothetical protein